MKKNWAALWQFIQFNMVGVSNTLVDFLVFTALTSNFGVVYITAKCVSYSVGLFNSYLWNTKWTFRKERRRTRKEIFLFICVNLVALGVSLLTIYACKTYLYMGSFYSNIVSIPFSMLINFLGNKLIVFNQKQ